MQAKLHTNTKYFKDKRIKFYYIFTYLSSNTKANIMIFINTYRSTLIA